MATIFSRSDQFSRIKVMTAFIRAAIVIVLCLVSLFVFVLNRLRNAGKVKRVASLLMLLCLYFPFLDISFTPFDVKITPFDFTLWAFFIINLDFVAEFKKYKLIPIIFGIMLFSAILSEFRVDSILSIPRAFRIFALFTVAGVWFQSHNDAVSATRSMVDLLKWPAISALILAMIQIIIAPDFSLYYSHWDKEMRISSCFLDPQIAGCCFAILSLWFLNLYLQYKRMPHLIFFFLLVVSGLYTASKVYVFGLVAGVVISLLKAKKIIPAITFVFITGIAVALSSKHFDDMLIFKRLQESDESLEGRKELYWIGAWDIFQNNMVTGIGPGVFQQYVEEYNYPLYHNIDGERVYAKQPESGYLLLLDQYGVLSIVFIVLAVTLFRRKARSIFDYRILLIPFMIGFISLYNLSSSHLVYLLSMISASLYGQSNVKLNKNNV